jgi:hypothetical protein
MATATGDAGTGGGSAMAVAGGSGGTAMAAYSATHTRTVLRDTPYWRAAAETLVARSGRSASWASASALPGLAKSANRNHQNTPSNFS